MKVLITDDVHDILIKALSEYGYEVDYKPQINFEECVEIISDYFGLIVNSKILIDCSFLDQCKKLKWIGRLGSGMEIIDLVETQKKGIIAFNTPEGNRDAVAEHTLAMLLSLFRNLNRADREVRDKIWEREKNRGIEVKGKKIGIVGCGNTGEAFAKLLSGFDCEVLIFDKYRQLFHLANRFKIVESLKEIMENADVISLHLPLTSETYHMVDELFLANCKQNIVLINTSRGRVVETKALVKALSSGNIKGACLDVFENEKVDRFTEEERKLYESLYKNENVVLTPHIAGWTHESKRKISELMIRKLKYYNLL